MKYHWRRIFFSQTFSKFKMDYLVWIPRKELNNKKSTPRVQNSATPTVVWRVGNSLVNCSLCHIWDIMIISWKSIQPPPPPPLFFQPYASFDFRALSSPASVCPCPCECQHRACPRHDSSPIHARITKLGPEVQNTLVNIPIFFYFFFIFYLFIYFFFFFWGGGRIDWCWSTRSNFNLKFQIYECLVCPPDKLHDCHVERAYINRFTAPTVQTHHPCIYLFTYTTSRSPISQSQPSVRIPI